jgi:IS5 family transposase
MKTIPLQLAFRPAVRTVIGNVDYTRFEGELKRIDELLTLSGVERDFVERSVRQYEALAAADGVKVRDGHIRQCEKQSMVALRSMILLSLLGESYRAMSRRLAECALFRWFCQIETLGPIRVPSKSTLQEYAQWLPEAEMREVVGRLLRAAGDGKDALHLANDIELERVWQDSTVVKTNIHFPVDWVLLRDAVRTLMKATRLIRQHGLKSRMEDPREFLKAMNRLSIEMTLSRRKAEAKRQRKKALRRMKKLVKVVTAHALRHRELLDKEWEKTDWTRKQAEQVLRRIDGILEQLPRVRKQAHERIIGERQVKNEDKILSLYERETRIIVRGKAGAEIEFGNTLLVSEQENGLLVDWKLYEESAPADSRLFQSSIQRTESLTGVKVKAAVTDRGFDSADNVVFLNKRRTFNGICPTNPSELRKRRRQRRFMLLQNRRSSTEGRIGIFKNVFVGHPMRVKGFARRELAIAWRVLTHNLWVLARLPQVQEEALLLQAA